MADFAAALKDRAVRFAKLIGRTAKKTTQAAKYKMDELSNISKHRDLIRELGEKTYELSCSGQQLPAEIAQIVEQITALDADLSTLRADYALKKAEAAEAQAAEKAARAAEKAAAKAEAAISKGAAPVEMAFETVTEPVMESEVVIAKAPDAPTMDYDAYEAEQAAEAEPQDVPVLKV